MLLQTLGYESIWVYTISVIVMVSMVTALLSCLCCRRKQEIKTSNAPHRSLPDIPIAEPVGDNNSELYATVGDKVQDLPQGRSPNTSLKKQTSVSQHSSISQADDISSPYARVRSPPHAYDKLRRMEHPYAQVIQPGTSGGPAGSSGVSGTGGASTSGTGNAQLGKGIRSKPRDGVDDDDEEEEEDDDDEELMSPISRRESAQNLDDREVSTADIPAASAIAGRVSASQDLPYMTPPIVQPPTQHFSGDSQDSSKGYTSISVREPLANLLPQNHPASQQVGGAAKRRQILGDSHYATVSDDSDEMYAAIDDPSTPGGGDLYTSGSETYAQIQPPPNAVTVAVEINMGASSRPLPPPVSITPNDGLDGGTAAVIGNHRLSNHSTMTVGSGGDEHPPLPVPPPPPPLSATIHGESAGGLRASQPHVIQHSRQASSSSCTSSVGNLGSPKPEKRQANSPLPPTPKTLKHQSNSSSFFSNSNQSMTVGGGGGGGGGAGEADSPIANGSIISSSSAASKPKKSPSKDLEGMYAKVMKKNKLSKVPSQNASPVPLRKDGTIDEQQHQQQLQQFLADSASDALSNGGVRKQPIFAKMSTVQHQHHRHSDQSDDPGYDTIATGGKPVQQQPPPPADYAKIQKLNRNAPSNSVTQVDSVPGYESLPDGRGSIRPDPGYETLNRSPRTESDSDPNYEVLRPTTGSSTNVLATVASSGKTSNDPNRDSDGYSSIREPGAGNRSANGGTARNRLDFGAAGHGDDDTDGSSGGRGGGGSVPGYSSIRETRRDEYDPGYSVISERKKPPPGHDYASITEEAKRRKPNINNNLEPVDDDSDIYSSIPHTLSSGTLTLPSPGLTSASASMVVSPTGISSLGVAGTGGDSGSGTTNYCTIPERPGSGGVPVSTGPNLSSSPGYSSISETRTTPSSTDGDGSTSSPDQPIGYGKHNNSNNTNTTTASITTNNSLSRLSSNYESLTGSESDPNYESVKYLNVKENPYERLHNEAGGGGGIVVATDPLRKSVTVESFTTDSDTATPTPSTVGPGDPAAAAAVVTTNASTPPVSDYFQV
ncbi:uncharacterized protein LOC126573516 isoform X2 [Anopheles aquasalis]|uniref:uncharacterized protein LOC126573516 isoform X2 n=1 Tax=Anopheles aquasalis TaxID=42839 RepID=UPI00215A204E|nr:uncharacterized protein LOC126573516 isoform X2 [Anopheles aquasalis]